MALPLDRVKVEKGSLDAKQASMIWSWLYVMAINVGGMGLAQRSKSIGETINMYNITSIISKCACEFVVLRSCHQVAASN